MMHTRMPAQSAYEIAPFTLYYVCKVAEGLTYIMFVRLLNLFWLTLLFAPTWPSAVVWPLSHFVMERSIRFVHHKRNGWSNGQFYDAWFCCILSCLLGIKERRKKKKKKKSINPKQLGSIFLKLTSNVSFIVIRASVGRLLLTRKQILDHECISVV